MRLDTTDPRKTGSAWHEARKRRLNWSLDELAHAAELPTAHVARLELGALRRLPPELRRIAAALGVALGELLQAAGHGCPGITPVEFARTLRGVKP